ncbi:hypothetical protein [Paenibacillus senegalensis]|uniref:hypothetical protein n=1 Tax=Paenibacillus senegalensis TaxID=1465766 RepID=UPI00028830CF|nr:hypothetical protein [Paenibacillus senegalensis]
MNETSTISANPSVNNVSLLVLESGCYFSSGTAERLHHDSARIRIADQYQLPQLALTTCDALAIDPFADQEWLYKHRALINGFLASGRLLLFSGHLFRQWLPGAGLFIPRKIRQHHDYTVSIVNPAHPLFQDVQAEELTYNRGVAGFFARGHHPPPEDAEVLLTLPDGEPITYVDRSTTKGTIVVHSGNNLLSHPKLGPRLLDWMQSEVDALRQRRTGP